MASPLASSPMSFDSPNNSAFFGLIKEDALPGQFGAATGEVPDILQTADTLKGYGGRFADQGAQALGMAQRGELTGSQQAELGGYRTGLTNQARQQFYNMGRTPDQDTAFISQTADIDAKVNAMAQQQIQSTIALGLGQTTAGSNFFGQSLGFDQLAMNTLIQAGQAQMKQDEEYRKQVSDTFAGIGKMVGQIGGTVLGGMVGGPIGAGIGGSLGGSLGGSAGSMAGGM